jgi:GTP cyclohydrolase II
MLVQIAERPLHTSYGVFREVLFYGGQREVIALVMGELAGQERVLCRIHSSCITGHVFNSIECDCREQMAAAQARIQEAGSGVVIYLDQEGKGNGHVALMQSIPFKVLGMKQGAAYEAAGYRADARDFLPAAQVLQYLGIRSVCLMTDNPLKAKDLEAAGVSVAGLVAI